MKKIITLIIFSLLTEGPQLLASMDDPSPSSEEKPQMQLTTAPAPERVELESVYIESAKKLEELKSLLRSGQNGPAYKMAIELLSEIKRKSGVSPTSKVREKIEVEGVLSNSDLKKNFSDLQNWQKEALRKAVDNHKSGYFIEILNLAKMVRVAYLHTFSMAMSQTIRERDKEKLRRDYLQAHNIEVLVKDKNASDAYMLFDINVADEDYQWAFNREIMEAALRNPIIGWTEDIFEQALIEDRKQRLATYQSGLYIPAPKPEKRGMSSVECYNKYFAKFYRGMSSSSANRASQVTCRFPEEVQICIGSQFFKLYGVMNSTEAYNVAKAQCQN